MSQVTVCVTFKQILMKRHSLSQILFVEFSEHFRLKNPDIDIDA